MNTKKTTSLLLALALVISSLAYGNPAATKASEAAQLITVYLAAQGKNASGAAVQIAKTPMQIEEGTTADVLVKNVLDSSDYKGNYEIIESSYGAYLESINGMGTESAGTDWYYWSFYVNGSYSDVGMGSYVLQDNDKISLIYNYEDSSTQAKDFVDDTTLNPDKEQADALIAAAKEQKKVLAEAIYQLQFGKDNVIPGLENADGLYTVFSLIQAGYENPEFYQAVYAKLVQQCYELKEYGKTKNEITGENITESTIYGTRTSAVYYAKVVLAVSAMGMDATDVGGFNLIEKMTSILTYKASANSDTRAAMVLLALDSGNYSLPEGEAYLTRTKLVSDLVKEIDNKIGTSISWGVDMAAMMIQPLAPYTEEGNLAEGEAFDRDSVKKACDKVLRFLESMQNAEGLYGDSFSSNNAWSLSQVMTVMGQFGIHPTQENDTDFIKNGKTVLDAAGAFVDVENNTVDENLMGYQPEQLLRGLTACLNVVDEKNPLYDVTATKDAPIVTAVNPVPVNPQSTATTPANTSNSSGAATTVTGGSINVTTTSAVVSVTAKKNEVIIARGKRVTVKYTVKMTETATTTAVVVAKSGNAKLVTAKIVGNKVKISAKKKAVKGGTTQVILMAGDKKAIIKVGIKNPAKKVKGKKQTITVKKNKKTNIVFLAKAENAKKAVIDHIDVKANVKMIKVLPKISVSKKKIVLKVKGLKKGKTTLQLKVGKKKAKVTVIVK